MKLLFCSFRFPPSRAARSLQLGKLTKYLARRGHEIDVVTVDRSTLGAFFDARVAEWINTPNIRTIELPNPDRSLRDKLAAAAWGHNFPGWAKAAGPALIGQVRKLGEQHYDALVSFAMPIDSHSAALACKRAFPKLPWIAHYSDPWANNPYSEVGNWVRQQFFNFAERGYVAAADLSVTVSEELTEHVASQYPARKHKFRTLHHVFDPEQYPSEDPPASGPVILRYLGGFSPRRTPAPLIDALRLAQQRGAPLENVRIELVGDQLFDADKKFNEVHPGLAVDRGRVNYWESLREMRTAHGLLLIDADQEVSPYFPSKLADYFGSRRPIIAITPPHSCSARLLREYGGACFEAAETEKVAQLLESIARGGAAALPPVVAENVARFEVDRLAAQFESLVQEAKRLAR